MERAFHDYLEELRECRNINAIDSISNLLCSFQARSASLIMTFLTLKGYIVLVIFLTKLNYIYLPLH